jgi:hypothetical protein
METPAIVPNVWVQASWEHFVALADEPALHKAKFYYDRGRVRVEMSPVGRTHAEDNYLVAQIISIHAFGCGLRLRGLTNVSLRKTARQEAQPDLAYYLGKEVGSAGGSDSPIDLDNVSAPALAVEVAATSLQVGGGRVLGGGQPGGSGAAVCVCFGWWPRAGGTLQAAAGVERGRAERSVAPGAARG